MVFFEVAEVRDRGIGRQRFVTIAAGRAVLHEPEAHNVLLIQQGGQKTMFFFCSSSRLPDNPGTF